MSKICLIYVGNLELKKSTITFPFLKWQIGKKEKIAIAHPISTSSKSPSKGEENKTLPTIENTFIITIRIKTQPPRIQRSGDKYNKKRPNLSFGRIWLSLKGLVFILWN